jgi:hypothetical protein
MLLDNEEETKAPHVGVDDSSIAASERKWWWSVKVGVGWQ